MPPRGYCAICHHPSRAAIEQAMVSGTASLRDIARQFDTPGHRISKDIVRRHLAQHVVSLIAAANERQQAQDEVRGDDLAGQLQALVADARRIKADAEAAKDARTGLLAIRELTRLVELSAKLSGALDQSAKHLHLHLPSRQEGVENAQELLLACLEPPELAAFMERLRERLGEDHLLAAPVIEGGALGTQPDVPTQVLDDTIVGGDCPPPVRELFGGSALRLVSA